MKRKIWFFRVMQAAVLVAVILPPVSPTPVLSAPHGLPTWTPVTTPSSDNYLIASPSEINGLAVGSDGRTLYAIDIPNKRVLKSTDAGVTWQDNISKNLPVLALPAWNIAVAPDDPKVVAVVTNNRTNIYFSVDSGATWSDAAVSAVVPPLAGTEYITSLALSPLYGGQRDICLGTRDSSGPSGRVLIRRAQGTGLSSVWLSSTPPGGGHVTCVAFSPAYASDQTVLAVVSNVSGTKLHFGHNLMAVSPEWDWGVLIGGVSLNRSATDFVRHAEIISANIQLPSDYNSGNHGVANPPKIWVSLDFWDLDVIPNARKGEIWRVDDRTPVNFLLPWSTISNGIASISYTGTVGGGKLLAAEAKTDSSSAQVNVHRCLNPTVTAAGAVTWDEPQKRPTGGAVSFAGSGYANGQVYWSPDGSRAFCGTGTATVDNAIVADPKSWFNSFAWTGGAQWDESAFSVSRDDAVTWNQISLIDTGLSYYGTCVNGSGTCSGSPVGLNLGANTVTVISAGTFTVVLSPGSTGTALSGTATVTGSPLALATGTNVVTTTTAGTMTLNVVSGGDLILTDVAVAADSTELYLASVNQVAGCFDSVWRSDSDPVGRTWERVYCFQAASDDIILRTNPRLATSTVIFLAVPNTLTADTSTVMFSVDKGQLWSNAGPGDPVTDLSVAGEDSVYVLCDYSVYRGTFTSGSVKWSEKYDTYLETGHTIATPFKNAKDEDWVVVGDGFGSMVSYANFLAKQVEFKRTQPIFGLGKLHVVCDRGFDSKKIVYAASDANDGKIYRWVLGSSIAWDQMEPPDKGFYGLAQEANTLYGAWWEDPPPVTNGPKSGVDRTLFPTAVVPPPPDWNEVTSGLPQSTDTNYAVLFTREPSSLKTSHNSDVYLWAIDDRPYDYAAKKGRLWLYIDMFVVVGPWSLAPAPGELVPADPVTGRNSVVYFKWLPMTYASEYEFWLANDAGFASVVTKALVVPNNPEGPMLPFPPGQLLTGHSYYWKVRASRADLGGLSYDIESPWSATMFFTVMVGLPVSSPYLGLMPTAPVNGLTGVPVPMVAFSWTQFKDTTEYQFQLASDPAMTGLLADEKVGTTSFEYRRPLDYTAAYFWRVRATRPAPSDWSSVFNFTTEAKPVVATPPPEAQAEGEGSPGWVWLIIGIVTLLFAEIIFLIFKKGSFNSNLGRGSSGSSPGSDSFKAVLGRRSFRSILGGMSLRSILRRGSSGSSPGSDSFKAVLGRRSFRSILGGMSLRSILRRGSSGSSPGSDSIKSVVRKRSFRSIMKRVFFKRPWDW